MPPLDYNLVENLLTDKENDYVAQVTDAESYDDDAIIERLIKRGTTVTKTDMLAFANLYHEEIALITAAGGVVNTRSFQTRFSISGNVEGASGKLTEANQTKLNAQPSKALKAIARQVSRRKKGDTGGGVPHVLQVKDSISGSVNDSITAGGVVEIVGSRLKIQGTDTDNGVYFIHEDDGTANKVVTLVNNQPGRLIVIVPTLKAGDYTLQIKTQYTGGKVLKNARTGTFDQTLTAMVDEE